MVHAALLKSASVAGRRQFRIVAVGLAILVAALATGSGSFHATHHSQSRPLAATTAAASAPSPDELLAEGPPQAGGKNIVHVVNRVDQRLRVGGRVQLNAIPAPGAAPVNL